MYSMSVNNITKKYMNSMILDNISFSFEKGKVYGLLGKNGAGKTTLLKLIVRLIPLKVYDKKVKILDKEKKISALIDNPSCYMNLSVEDNLRLYSALLYKNDLDRKSVIDKIVKEFKLEPMMKKKVKAISLGMLQKLKLAMAFMSDSNILILDEPFNGLDIESSLLLKQKISESKKLSKTIVITSHNTEQLEKICDSFAILHDSNISNVTKEELENNTLEKIYCDILYGDKNDDNKKRYV